MTKISHYDYIVIGAGSAGSIVASKLAAYMAITNALWHFCRGMAHAASGFTSDAQAERKIFSEATVKIPDDAEFANSSASRSPVVAPLMATSVDTN